MFAVLPSRLTPRRRTPGCSPTSPRGFVRPASTSGAWAARRARERTAELAGGAQVVPRRPTAARPEHSRCPSTQPRPSTRLFSVRPIDSPCGPGAAQMGAAVGSGPPRRATSLAAQRFARGPSRAGLRASTARAPGLAACREQPSWLIALCVCALPSFALPSAAPTPHSPRVTPAAVLLRTHSGVATAANAVGRAGGACVSQPVLFTACRRARSLTRHDRSGLAASALGPRQCTRMVRTKEITSSGVAPRLLPLSSRSRVVATRVAALASCAVQTSLQRTANSATPALQAKLAHSRATRPSGAVSTYAYVAVFAAVCLSLVGPAGAAASRKLLQLPAVCSDATYSLQDDGFELAYVPSSQNSMCVPTPCGHIHHPLATTQFSELKTHQMSPAGQPPSLTT